MKTVYCLAACMLPLAACNNSPEVHEENASVAEVQNKVANAVKGDSWVRPGRWESKVTIEEMSIPGMGDMTEQMKGMGNRIETQASCLTEEDAKRPKEDFFSGDNKNCRYDNFNMGGGKIDAVMKCGDGQATQVMTLTGGYTPDTYNMQMSMQSQGGAQAGMKMRMRVDAKRAGECTGKES